MSDVARVAAIEHSKGKTIAAATLGGAAVAGALVYIFSHSGSGSGLAVIPSDTMTL